MKPVLSCRDSVYTSFDDAVERLPDAGIRAMELTAATADNVCELTRRAAAHGLSIATVGTGVNLADAESMSAYEALMEASTEAGIEKIFTSISARDRAPADPEILVALRGLASRAEDLGLLICMETHEPFGHNAARARRTVDAVGSRVLRLNFDTANIYYYNESIDGLSELKQIVDQVASVHLKDTPGGYHDANFPVLGQGIVDFKATFDVCLAAGIEGPYTLELEGPLTSGKSSDERHTAVKACVGHLQAIGVV